MAKQTTFLKLTDRQYRSLGMVQRCIKQAAVAHEFGGSTAQSSHSSPHNYFIIFNIFICQLPSHIKNFSANTLLHAHLPLSESSRNLNYKLRILISTITIKMCKHYTVYYSCGVHSYTREVECAAYRSNPAACRGVEPVSSNQGEACPYGCPGADYPTSHL